MIRDNIKNIERYSYIHPDMNKVINYLKTSELEPGIHNISNDVFINVMEYETRDNNDLLYETHKHYADIQLILNGEERHFYAGGEMLKIVEEYSEDKDIAFLKPLSQPYSEEILLKPGDFTVYFPGEAHAPNYNFNDKRSFIKKAVVKIKLK